MQNIKPNNFGVKNVVFNPVGRSLILHPLKSETSGFGSTLENASGNIDQSVSTISKSVANMEEGSSQLNSLLFPIVASIAIILALQIVIIARRR